MAREWAAGRAGEESGIHLAEGVRVRLLPMRFLHHPFAPSSWLAARRDPAPSADALTMGWWIEPGRPAAPEATPTLRRIVSPPQRARAL